MADILITGGTGQIGRELARLEWAAGLTPHFPDRSQLDLSSRSSIEACLNSRSWGGVINCAAYTAVDQAEHEVGQAFAVNAHGPAWLAEATRRSDIPLIHVSTDYVFDGAKLQPYTEVDDTRPACVYGASKLAGELAVRFGNPRSVILRTAWVISAHRSNFLRTMLRLGARDGAVRVVSDQCGNPTAAADVADAIHTIMMRLLADPATPAGTYHCTNGGDASWCDLARWIFSSAHRHGLDEVEVTPIATADYPTAAQRPKDSRLATEKIATQFGIQPRHWQLAVSEIISELAATGLFRESMQ